MFRGPLTERESTKGAEFVEDGSVVIRSGTVQRSRDRPLFGLGFGPNKNTPIGRKTSGIHSSPNILSKDKTFLHKTAKQSSSEFAEPRRLPTASFGCERKQEIHPEVGSCGAQATQDTKRKLNPFVEDCEASATRKNASTGIMPLNRMHGLVLPEPLSLDKFAALIMSPLGASRSSNINKKRFHPEQTRVNTQTLTLPMSTEPLLDA